MWKDLGKLVLGVIMITVAVSGFMMSRRPPLLGLVLLTGGGAYLIWSATSHLRWVRMQARYGHHSDELLDFVTAQVRILRSMGFFGSYRELSDVLVARELISHYEQECGEDTSAELVEQPMLLALLDPARAVHLDTEMSLLPGDGGYTQLLEDATRISRGSFEPTGIEETLTPDAKHVDVRFQVNGEPQHMRFAVNDDWMDPNFWPALNKFVEPDGFEYVVPHWGGQDFIVLCLATDEQKRLREELRWRF